MLKVLVSNDRKSYFRCWCRTIENLILGVDIETLATHVLGVDVEHVPDDEAVLRVAFVSKGVVPESVRRGKKSNF
jgi:hypothetical protein